MHTIEFIFLLPLAKLIAPVQEVEQAINAHLATVGYEREKITICTEQSVFLKVDQLPSDTQLSQMKELLLGFMRERFGSVQLKDVRCQSGNVQQSASSAS
ncbi:MAG TPA: hypothetical protein VEH27_00825 [Methylomirabilota bacterium]|nr:hypothetical protein [Methylomirabilota bacterium]